MFSSNKELTLFIIICMFIFGLYYTLVTTEKKKMMMEYFTMRSEFKYLDNAPINKTDCPTLLVKENNRYKLFNTNKKRVPGVNPISFRTLKEYEEYTEWQRKNGIRCPVLFLEKSFDTQGNETYRMKNSLNGSLDGVDQYPSVPKVSHRPKVSSPMIDPIPEYEYKFEPTPGFDPLGLDIGIPNRIDNKFNQKEMLDKSDNPLDSNFAGPRYAYNKVKSGAYEKRYILRNY